MVRSRGSFERIEKVLRKKRPRSCLAETELSSVKEQRNALNDHILSLYRKGSPIIGKSSLNSSPVSAEPNFLNDEIKELKLVCATSASKSSRSFKNIQEKNYSSYTLKYPTVTFDDVAGLDEILSEIFFLFFHLKDPEKFSDVKKDKYIILHGPPGCGKTHLVHAIAGETGLPLLEVPATELVCSISGKSESKIREIFAEALESAPCILFIDSIDAIASKKDSLDSRSMEKRIVTQLLTSLDELKEVDNTGSVKVIAATHQLDSIDRRLLSRFYSKFHVSIPNEKARLMILHVYTKHLSFSPEFDMEWIVRHTPGYTGSDLYQLVEKGLDIALKRMYGKYIKMNIKEAKNKSDYLHSISWPKTMALYFNSDMKIPDNPVYELQDFQEALKVVTPSFKTSFPKIPDITWENVGALKEIKKELQETILWPVKYRKVYENSNIESSKGILLYGPKGCGKTLLAKVIANECSLNFLSIKGSELLSKYLGESERSVRQCFQTARSAAPCVIFFDEFDAICPNRTNSDTNAAAERVVNALLAEMDGVETLNEVFVIGATNRLDKIDSAMLRPGRLGNIIYVGLPSPADRADILKSLTKNKTSPKISDDVDFEKIAYDLRCDNFNGADLHDLIRVASKNAVRELVNTSSDCMNDTIEIRLKDFEAALNKVKPSVTKKDIRYYKRIREQQY